MPDVVLLDAGPLGMASHPRPLPKIAIWLGRLLGSGTKVVIPEIADYEVRRELLRAGKSKSVGRLDALKATLDYLPISTPAVLKAAEFWATARQLGRPTAHDKSLDADAILAGQAATYPDAGADVLVASSNSRHIARFVNACNWDEITP